MINYQISIAQTGQTIYRQSNSINALFLELVTRDEVNPSHTLHIQILGDVENIKSKYVEEDEWEEVLRNRFIHNNSPKARIVITQKG